MAIIQVKRKLFTGLPAPEGVWLHIEDLAERVVEAYQPRAAAGYHTKQTIGPGDHIAAEALPKLRLAVAETVSA